MDDGRWTLSTGSLTQLHKILGHYRFGSPRNIHTGVSAVKQNVKGLRLNPQAEQGKGG